ncbi:MAG TPA: aminoglycoside phosphotransferase family protein [Propionicimonas sp.]|uniref:phosphotransferase family protein n=1 Tax=Propionicimonas sp. TaxID=1955623 RepID=UPI002F3EF3A3
MVLGPALPERALAWAQQNLAQQIVEVGPIGGGLTRTKWLLRLADGARVVVRWCDPTDWGDTGREHVRRETLACQLLAGSGLPVPRLIAADLDATLTGGPANLVTWLPGAVRLDRLRPAAVGGLAGLALAVHRQPVADERRPPVFSYRGPAEPEVPGWTSRPALWERAIDLRAAGAPSTPFGLIHRDFHFGNILWERGSVSGVVDWAETSWGPADLDVAHLCSDVAMLHATADADAVREAYLRRGGRLEPAEFRYWQVSDILGFLPDPGHILPAVAPARPDLTAASIRRGLEDLLAATLG